MVEKHTHHCVRAIYNGKMRLRECLVEYERFSTECAAGLAGAHPGLQDRILLSYTRIENAHKIQKKTCIFLLCIEVKQTFSFPFSLLRHYQIPEYFYVKNCCYEYYNSSIMLHKLVMQPMRSAHALFSQSRQNKDNCFG